MLNSRIKQDMFCLALGSAVAVASIFTIGYTMALTAPRSFFEWFRSYGALDLGLLVWDTTVVFGLATGVLAFLALLGAYRIAVLPTLRSMVLFLLGFLVVVYIVVPLTHGTPMSLAYSRPWWGYGLEVTLIAAALSSFTLARRLWPDNSFELNPLRGST